ncbi:RNA polymerase sigma-70 factor [Arthrospiribacter ruber]|uniref:RNA polymerase sigma-70 factor n=1 Tax=Arthrospiribacter ruber TaxID=2487934 RepID=A0A951MCP8_9BACT|nr:RNA polymerase sigma-70 factor [Arthrospiribacter ruber]
MADFNFLDIKTLKGFENAYRQYASKVYAVCRSQIKSREIAEEIVQDIFRSLWERRNKIDLREPLEHYLIRSAKLKVIDYFRQKQRDQKHLACAMQEYCLSENCTEDTLAFNELHQQISELVDMLPCHCREVYKLSREEGLSNKEIAERLDISLKTVEYHMGKALRFLKDSLQIG